MKTTIFGILLMAVGPSAFAGGTAFTCFSKKKGEEKAAVQIVFTSGPAAGNHISIYPLDPQGEITAGVTGIYYEKQILEMTRLAGYYKITSLILPKTHSPLELTAKVNLTFKESVSTPAKFQIGFGLISLIDGNGNVTEYIVRCK